MCQSLLGGLAREGNQQIGCWFWYTSSLSGKPRNLDIVRIERYFDRKGGNSC
jgi:hypothetical protein